MKKNLLLIAAFIAFFVVDAMAKHINEDMAKRVGQTFLAAKPEFATSLELHIVYKALGDAGSQPYSVQTPLFYVFNTNTRGFVIVAADDNALPILGYSCLETFDAYNMPQNVQKWLEAYKNEIHYIINNEIEATADIQAQWEAYSHNRTPQSIGRNTNSVSPLVQTRWSQSPYYNALCPSSSVTGCVATAMAQVMKYWDFPTRGTGFHSYNHPTYGTLSANFGNTSYQWSSMPNSVNSSNSAVATLMYHCGVSVDMDYSPQGSGAYVIESASPTQNCAEYALKTYFGYKSTMQGVERQNYSQTQWTSLLRTELDAGRPILYAGFGAGGGHAFVCDGYDVNDYFHFNWGWGGAYDGYFWINGLNPTGTGTGGGSGGYNSNHQAIIGIEPSTGSQTQVLNMTLYDYLAPSLYNIPYNSAFSITTNIANRGTATFNGDYGAAIFDAQYNFVDFVEVLTGYTLWGGYVHGSNLVFSTNGMPSLLPGTYYVAVYYRPTGENWTAVSNYSTYTNWISIEIINTNTIELNSAITVAQGTTVQQGQAMSVNVNVKNSGTATFVGDYQANLYNTDGSFAQAIGTMTDGNGLPGGYTYSAPYLNFSANVTVAPGTYLLGIVHKSSSSSTWQLTGTGLYQNPITITVQAPALSPDVYENNDAWAQAYSLAVNFGGNTAAPNTTGSNCHTTSDNDYYKINLAQGYDYTITARLHDSYNSGNGNTYSLDALFSYSTDGNVWSSTYDDVMSNNIIMRNGGTLYIRVAPYFTGSTGTYLFQTNITRTATTVGVTETTDEAAVTLYPNPAKDFAVINCEQLAGEMATITVFNAQGQPVQTTTSNNKHVRLSLRDMPSGAYMVRIQSAKGSITKPLVVAP